MLNLSPEAANVWFGIFNIAVIVGALLGGAGAIGIFWTGAMRDHYSDLRISHNEAQAALAKENAAKADEGAAKASERAAELTKQATALQVDLERERTARLKMEERLAATHAEATAASKRAAAVDLRTADRHLTPDQRRILVDAIKPFAGTKIAVSVPAGDKESLPFAAEFVAAFRDAGWDPGAASGISQALYSGEPSFGIQVTVNEHDARNGQFPRGFEVLAHTLVSLGLASQAYLSSQIPSGSIEFRIMPKEPAAAAAR
jgi:hypothetical protein